ncbi:MAG: hypothetical protein ABIB71_08170 [Candidatus Woesearchaeota archaeon]
MKPNVEFKRLKGWRNEGRIVFGLGRKDSLGFPKSFTANVTFNEISERNVSSQEKDILGTKAGEKR